MQLHVSNMAIMKSRHFYEILIIILCAWFKNSNRGANANANQWLLLEADNYELVQPPTGDIEQKVVGTDHLAGVVFCLARVDAVVNGRHTCQLESTPWKF